MELGRYDNHKKRSLSLENLPNAYMSASIIFVERTSEFTGYADGSR